METSKSTVATPENGSIIETKILSFGELLVGVDFNPSVDPKISSSDMLQVYEVKKKMAEIANLMKDAYNTEQKSPIKSLLFDHAVGELVNAQMAVVKLITFKS